MNNLAFGAISRALSRSFSYKSALSLENLYPNSSLRLKTLSQSSQIPPKEFNGFIPIDALQLTYSKSSGPGGQNVNKVNTKVDARFHLESAKWLPEEIKTKLKEQLKNRLTVDGYLLFKSDLTRSQQLNVADCIQKIRDCIRKATVKEATPSVETMERVRRRIERATLERLREKHLRSMTKADRRAPDL